MGKHHQPISERLAANSMPITECGCLIWLGAVGGRMGYGHMKVDGAVQKTHRLSWEEDNGKIPDGMSVLHHCDIPTCLNPEHLFLGDHDANMADKKAKRRAPHGADHHRREVSENQAVEIRTSTASISELAAKFGLGYGTVWQIRNRKRWKYIEASK